MSKFYFDRPGIPSIALTTDTSVITAIGNDYGYDKIFTRQPRHKVWQEMFLLVFLLQVIRKIL